MFGKPVPARIPALVCALGCLMALAAPASALTISDDMDTAPGGGHSGQVYPWTTVVFAGTSMVANAGVLSMTTRNGEGIWFGNQSGNPGWNLGSNAAGNYLGLAMRMASPDASGPEDWYAYFHDLDGYGAGLVFNPSSNGSYSGATQYGFSYSYADGIGGTTSTFVPFDLADSFHTFEVLLKDAEVQYWLDGQSLFHGAASNSGTNNFLLIGDDSAVTPTGTGSMFVDSVVFESGTSRRFETATVPLAGTLGLLLAGLGLLRLPKSPWAGQFAQRGEEARAKG